MGGRWGRTGCGSTIFRTTRRWPISPRRSPARGLAVPAHLSLPPSGHTPVLALQRRRGGDAISTAALRRDAVAPTHGGARSDWYRHLKARPPFVLSPAPVSVGCPGAEKATLQYKCNVARIASGTARGVRASLYLVARRRLQFFGIFLARTNHFGATALNNIHTRETSRQVAAKCGAAPRSLTPKRRGRPHKVAEIGECRGPRNGSLWRDRSPCCRRRERARHR